MADPVRVSRQGLTCCPGCKSYIKLADSVAQTSCPFCQASLLDARAGASKPRFGTKGRSLLAASLLGATMVLTACPGAEPTEKTSEQATEKVSDGGLPAPAYGVPAPDVTPDTKPAPDSTDGPLYGIAPDQ